MIPPRSPLSEWAGSFARSQWNRRVLAIATALLSAAILGTILVRQWQVLVGYDWSLRWEPVVASFVVFSIDLVLVSLIWASLMNNLGDRIEVRKHLRIYLLTHAARRLPGRIWHVAGRAFLYKKEGVPAVLTSMASALELTVMAMSGIVIALAFGASIVATYQFGIAVLVAVFVAGSLLLSPRVLEALSGRFDIRPPIRLEVGRLVLWFSAYLIVWILGGVTLFAVGMSVAKLSLGQLPFVIGSWSLVGVVSSVLILLPSQLGITEVALSLILSNIMPAPVAVVVSLLARVLITVFELLWAAVSVRFWLPA